MSSNVKANDLLMYNIFSSIAPCLSRFFNNKSKSPSEAKSSNTLPRVSIASKRPSVPKFSPAIPKSVSTVELPGTPF